MKKKSVRLISSVIVLALLGGAYAGVRIYVDNQEKKEAEAEEAENEDITLFSASADSLETIEFLINEKVVDFDYDSEKDIWTKRDEADFPVSQDKLSEVAGAISGINADRVLENVENLTEYGLDTPENTIKVTTTAEEEITIRVGDENEGISQYYVSVDDDDTKVYMVASALIEPFMGGLYDYAESGTFPDIQSANIKEITVEQGKVSYTLTEDEESGLWNVSDGENTDKADSASAASLTSSLAALEYSSFVNYDCEKPEEYGLEEPYATITAVYEEEEETDESNVSEDSEESEEDEEFAESEEESSTEETSVEEVEEEPVMVEKELILYVGDQAEGDTRYVMLDGSREVYTISEELLSSLLDKDITDFWDLSLGYTSLGQMENLVVDRNGETVTIDVSRETSEDEDGEETETTTYLLDGTEMEDTSSFQTFYNKLTSMTAQQRLQEEYTPETEAEMTTVTKDVEGNSVETSFYSYDTNFYAAVSGGKVYLVNKVNVRDMLEAYDSFANGGEETEETEEAGEAIETEETEVDAEE